MNSPQTKSDYFAVSVAQSIPARCPLLERCERRAHTIADANEWPLERAAQVVGLKKPLVKSIGEGAGRIGGANNFISGGQCPEVNLFESSHALPGFAGKPTTKGEYDKNLDPQFIIIETGHYSQCAEYSSYAANPSGMRHGGLSSWVRTNYKWIVAILGAVGALITVIVNALK